MPKISQRYAKDMQKIRQRYAKDRPEICQRYAKICQRQLPKALGPLALKAVTVVKALELLHHLYKLSQLRLAVTAVKAVQLLHNLYKLSQIRLAS